MLEKAYGNSVFEPTNQIIEIMKLSNRTCVALAALMATALVCRAGDAPAGSSYLNTLSAVPQIELPAKAAGLVAQADAKSQSQTTVDVIKTVVGLNPAAAPEMVGAVAQQTPEMAPTAAGTAVSLVPNQAVAIARAAAAAAPKQAGKIVEAVCRVLPKTFRDVANAVAEVVPGAGREILTGVSAAIPSLQGPINAALTSSKDGTPSVSATLASLPSLTPAVANNATPVSVSAQPMITFKPPYVPPPATPGPIDPGSGGDVTGSRGYSAPPPP